MPKLGSRHSCMHCVYLFNRGKYNKILLATFTTTFTDSKMTTLDTLQAYDFLDLIIKKLKQMIQLINHTVSQTGSQSSINSHAGLQTD